MKSQNRFVLMSSLVGITFVLYFSAILETVPELNAQAPADNNVGNKIIMHTHSSLNVTVNGNSILVPNGVGINSTLWNDHSLDEYGTARETSIFGMVTPAMSPLHTHDSSGIIHVESIEYKNYTLGDFLSIWGFPLEGKKVSLVVGGNSTENYSTHILNDMEKLILKIED
ncbi:MAG TPA: hypothetical protein VJ599_05640 [Nitrososphaeraceae archaeon]|nr:hypothetical protein [Nitrososphaeraceae archaeon]